MGRPTDVAHIGPKRPKCELANCRDQCATARLFSTYVTSGALHAADPALIRSSHELAVPASVTLLPTAVTVIFSASISASRLSAFSIASLTAVG